MSNRNTAKRQQDKSIDQPAKRGAGQAEALDHSTPASSTRRPSPVDRLPLEEEEARQLEDVEEFTLPPLHGKVHPPAEMGDVTPTLDDEVRSYHHHPNDAGAVAFGFDPDAADAAADLAGDLGSHFLEGATRGEDLSELVLEDEDRTDSETPFLIEDELEAVDGEASESSDEQLLEEIESATAVPPVLAAPGSPDAPGAPGAPVAKVTERAERAPTSAATRSVKPVKRVKPVKKNGSGSSGSKGREKVKNRK